MKSKTTATILCLFLGGFGIHRFYLGQTGLGLLYLAFFWTLIPGLIALVDFIVLLLMSEETFNQKYNLTSIIMQSKIPSSESNNVNTVAINMAGSQNSSTSPSDEIMKLYELKEKGIITQEEFDLKKKTIL